MGVLSDFDLAELIGEYGCRFLIETGTGSGKNVDFAAQHRFEQIYSIESKHALALQAGLRFSKNPMITIIHGRTERGLKEALEEIPGDASVIYWLTALSVTSEVRPADNKTIAPLPLERELRLLAECRDISRDVFLIDQLRIYEDGDFEDGPCPADLRPAPENRHTRFVEDILGSTHRLERSLRRTGYLSATPVRSV